MLGHIVTRQGNAEVTAHDSGQLVEWLAHHDDPVSPGQPSPASPATAASRSSADLQEELP